MTGHGVRCTNCGTALALPTRVSWAQNHAKLVYFGLFCAAAAAVIVPASLAGRDVPPETSPKPQAPVIVHPTETQLEKTARTAEEAIDRYWETARPLFVDIDGDSIADPIGTVRYAIHRDELRLAAHSGKDGHLLWESESLGPKLAVQQETLARVDGMIVWGSTYAPLIAGFDVKTGTQLWKVTPEEVLDYYCRVNDQFVLVLKDKSQLALDRATGALTKLAKPIDCRETKRQGSGSSSNFQIEGMSIYEPYEDADGVIFTGRKAVGTEVAMIAASDRNGTLLWSANLSARAPLTARRPTSSAPDFDRDIVAEPIEDDGKQYLEVFDRVTGKHELDVPIFANNRAIMTISTVVAKAAIYVVIQDDLQAYSRTTGALLWHLRQ